MLRLNLVYFYGLGSVIGRLISVALSDDKLNDSRYSSAISSAKEWVAPPKGESVAAFPKRVKALEQFHVAIEKFEKLLGADRKPTVDEYMLLVDANINFSKVFEQELEDARAYLVTPMGAYSVTGLLENASSHLSSTTQTVIGPETKNDFDEAGRCLSLDLYTACGFHAMRALEYEARVYHEMVTGVKMVDVPIGVLINGDQKNYAGSGLTPKHQQEGGKNDSPLGLIISLLASINKIYRCPVMHPEMALGRDEAKLVFDLSATSISAMIDDGVDRVKKQLAAGKP